MEGLCSLFLICSRKLWYSLICLLALERRLQEQHPLLGYQKCAQTSNKNLFHSKKEMVVSTLSRVISVASTQV